MAGKDRREDPTFIGAEGVMKHLKDGPPRRRVGLIVEGAPARTHAKIFAPESAELIGQSSFSARLRNVLKSSIAGEVTSGIPSPTLGKNIAMGYVKSGMHKKGTEVNVEVRGKKRSAVITPMPFVKSRYFRG